ncbi:hypothetical protein UFOVP806_39 [uncultured Caudovirales phage]|uniref:Uncharacterized protein n=1 Tax=uncultured Caudovirales phage TaxID=2100421 RepID=A0A6J5NXH1_9CAUD|nr:hypothetical protein UFOVP806_39 [uncultured Caudovirales phage]
MPDLTQDYIRKGIGNIASMIQESMDPRTQIALQAARRDAELHPLRQKQLEADAGLSAARALTEGAQRGYYENQAADQAMRTRYRGMLMPQSVPMAMEPAMPQAAPNVAPMVDQLTNGFNAAANSMGIPLPQGQANAAPMTDADQQPNPLLPPMNAFGPGQPSAPVGGYSLQDLARIVTGISENPNAPDFVAAQARARALDGPFTEEQARQIALAQGLMPNVNTAVTPQTQTDILSAKAAVAQAMNDADNAALMQRTQLQQQGALARDIATARAGGGPGKVSYSDRRNMQEDAERAAYEFLKIQRDQDGNVIDPLIAKNPAVLDQAKVLAIKAQRLVQDQGMNPREAVIVAAQEIFGSADVNNPAYFNPAISNWFGIGDRPLSAKNINQDAIGIDRTASPELNGPSTAGDAMKSGMLGVADGQQATVIPMRSPGVKPSAVNAFALRPSNAEVEQRKVNQAKVAELKGRVAQIEDNLKSGKMSVPTMNPYGFSAGVNKFVDLAGNNDAFNQQAQLRLSLLQEIAKLEGSTGNAESIDDIVRRNLTR